MATFTGTAGADIADATVPQLVGFSGGFADLTDAVGDTFVGDAGDDIVSAGGGDDVISGGEGDDTLRGNGGADAFLYNEAIAAAGKDVIDGGDGLDDLRIGGKVADFTEATIFSFGAASIDRLTLLTNAADHHVRFLAAQVGDAGVSKTLVIQGDNTAFDRITFDAAADLDLSGFTFNLWNEAIDRIFVNGTEAGDIIIGASVADTIAGGDAGDDLRGGGGADVLDGGAGFDILVGGAGADVLSGGEGNDFFRYFSNDEIGADVIGGGADFDVLSLNFTGLADFTGATIDSGPTPSIERLELVGAGHDVRFNGSQVGDGGLASDLMIVGDASGLDQVSFFSASSLDLSAFQFTTWDTDADLIRLFAAAGGSTLTGSSMRDQFTGDVGADVASGGGGNDEFFDSDGADILRGEAGNDIFVYTANAAIAGDAIDGGTDSGGMGDSLLVGYAGLADFTGATIASTGATSIEFLRMNGAGHDVRFNALQVGGNGLAANLMIQGSDTGADLVTFGNAAMLDLSGFTFTEWDEAVDRIVVYAGAEPGASVTGTGVADSIVGNGASNMLGGNGGADFLFGVGFNPDGTMIDSFGTDILNGGDGDDGLFAAGGGDTVNGGDGNDGLVGGGGEDKLNGGAGTDFLFGGAFSLAGARIDGSGADTLNGGEGNDGLYGFDGADIILGDAGNDYIEGGAGNDIMNGGADSDFLLGGADDDTLNGGAGFDYMYGEAGADTFVFKKGDSADWILDFSAAQGDKVRFEGFGFANFAAIPLVDLSTPGNPAVQLTFIESGNVDQLTIFGITLAQLNAGNVLVV